MKLMASCIDSEIMCLRRQHYSEQGVQDAVEDYPQSDPKVQFVCVWAVRWISEAEEPTLEVELQTGANS